SLHLFTAQAAKLDIREVLPERGHQTGAQTVAGEFACYQVAFHLLVTLPLMPEPGCAPAGRFAGFRPADGLPGLLAGARPSGRLAAFTALRLCRPGGRVTFFDAKKVTKETGLCQREVPLIGGLARTGTAADAHPRSSPCEASCLASLCQPTNQGALPMAVSQTQDQNRSPARQAPTAVPLSCRSLPCRRTVL